MHPVARTITASPNPHPVRVIARPPWRTRSWSAAWKDGVRLRDRTRGAGARWEGRRLHEVRRVEEGERLGLLGAEAGGDHPPATAVIHLPIQRADSVVA